MNGMREILELHRAFTRERNWDQFQIPKNLAMALSVEAAELVEIFMWLTPSQSASLEGEKLLAAEEEIADVFIYLLRLADTLGVDPVDAARRKMEKSRLKHPLEKAHLFVEQMKEKSVEIQAGERLQFD